jgi:uncharacterized OsmC-like protein
MSERPFDVTLDQDGGYQFTIDFAQPGVAPLVVDESAPLGSGNGPNPARVLAAAVGHCLGASLLFCLNKARVPVDGLSVHVHGEMVRNEKGRLRIGRLSVQLRPEVSRDDQDRLGRCNELFEDFCIVTESVRHGIDVDVAIEAMEPSPVPTG